MSGYLNTLLSFVQCKYRQKCSNDILFLIVIYSSVYLVFSYNSKCKDLQCVNGECINGTCICQDGWQGPYCQFCGGKIRLSDQSGYIYDGFGNYSVDIKCSWLIDVGGSNTTIRLRVEEFSTECGWDYLYIFDGDSVHSPLIAVLSGLMYTDNYAVRRLPEIVTTSGYALIHFYSDIAVNMSGFNISYRLNSCPSRTSSVDCSGNGICIDGVCTCDAMFTGEACDVPVCPNNCSYSNGVCRREQHKCDCNPKYKGDDCSQVADNGYWEAIQTKGFLPQGSASHTAVVWRDWMYIIGGESYNKAEMIYVYDLNGNVWETPHMDSKNVPMPRYGHSSVLFGDKIYVYGGVMANAQICNELWAFDINANTWENITVRSEPCIHTNNTAMCGPLRSVGHSATLFTNKSLKSEIMIVTFGYSPIFGFLNTVQEYHFGTREWKIVKTKGFPVKGGYGHSSAWDPLTQRIYVYGGFISSNLNLGHMSDRLYSYDPNSRTWKMLMSAPSPRYLHTANFIDGLMLVFGGNTYNGSLKSDTSKCYSHDFLMYDVYCNCWSVSAVPHMFHSDLARFGHSAVVFEGSLYIYGGFNGQMMNDILKFTPGNCYALTSQSACLNMKPGLKCIWDRNQGKCLPNTAISRSQISSYLDRPNDSGGYIICAEESRAQPHNAMTICSSLTDCQSCVQTSLHCGWCPQQGLCTYGVRCKEPLATAMGFTTLRPYQICSADENVNCHNQHTCQACSLTANCHWYRANSFCVPLANLTIEEQQEVGICPSSCFEYTTCLNCTENSCMWCHNEERCIDKNGYLPSFPYGQCREWTTSSNRCRPSSGKSACSFYKSCVECQADPECGWCDDGSGTGLGACLPGGNTNPQTCSKDNWYFTRCPSCQCNGHSTCPNYTNICSQPCGNFTHGLHCERCIHGYYGNALNGGTCTPCECNNQANQCHVETGRCFCTTKGIIGDHCEKCDSQNHYHGDPTVPHGSCFYELTIDYQFTFNLSKKEDRHFRQINFKNTPPKSDVDADFNIMCSVPAKMNITKKTGDRDKEKVLLEAHNCSNFRTKFSKNEHIFGIDNNDSMTTFYVYVYDFHPPLWIQISFSQYPKLNLQQFFITFSSCFLLLLLVAAILWKLKQKYDTYRRRQRLFVEMEQMARRPFSTVQVEMNPIAVQEKDVATISVSDTLSRRKKEFPNPIAMEPCGNNKAAVLSLIVRLPTGNEAYAPSGQAGIAVASALVTLGNSNRKISMDSTVKTDLKGKSRKCAVSNQNTDNTCI